MRGWPITLRSLMPALNLSDFATRLDQLVAELDDAYHEYATIWAAERLQKAQTANNTFRTGHEREAYTLAATAQISVQLVEVSQHIKALEAERDYIMFVLDHSSFRYA